MQAIEALFAPYASSTAPGLVAGIRARLTRQSVEGYVGCMEALGETDLVESTARLHNIPCLGLASAEDGSTPPDLVRETVESIPGAQFTLLRRTGHLACVEDPEGYVAALVPFLARVGALA